MPRHYLDQYQKSIKEKNKEKDEAIKKWRDIAKKITEGLLQRLVDETLDDIEQKTKKSKEKNFIFKIANVLPKSIETKENKENKENKKSDYPELWEYFRKNIEKSKYAPLLDDLEKNHIDFFNELCRYDSYFFFDKIDKILDEEGFIIKKVKKSDPFYNSEFTISWDLSEVELFKNPKPSEKFTSEMQKNAKIVEEIVNEKWPNQLIVNLSFKSTVDKEKAKVLTFAKIEVKKESTSYYFMVIEYQDAYEKDTTYSNIWGSTTGFLNTSNVEEDYKKSNREIPDCDATHTENFIIKSIKEKVMT